MLKRFFILSLFIVAAASRLYAEEPIAAARELQKQSATLLKDLEEAFGKEDFEKAKWVGESYGTVIQRLDAVATQLRNEGRFDDVRSLEQKLRLDTLEHQEVLHRVRDLVPPQAQEGIDRSFEVALRSETYANTMRP